MWTVSLDDRECVRLIFSFRWLGVTIFSSLASLFACTLANSTSKFHCHDMKVKNEQFYTVFLCMQNESHIILHKFGIFALIIWNFGLHNFKKKSQNSAGSAYCIGAAVLVYECSFTT